jgi:hypothetical protein
LELIGFPKARQQEASDKIRNVVLKDVIVSLLVGPKNGCAIDIPK